MNRRTPTPLLAEPLAFRDAAEEFGICNMQPDEPQAAIIERLKEEDFRDVIVLSGPEGIGRSYLVRAAHQRARWAGIRTRYQLVDISGAEPGLSWNEHLEGLLEAAADRNEGPGWGELLRSLSPRGLEMPFADTSLTLALAFGVPLKLFSRWLNTSEEGERGLLSVEPRQLVRKLFAWFTSDEPAILHLRNGHLVDQARWSLFLDEAAINGRILVVTSVATGAAGEERFRHRRFRSVLPFELEAIGSEEQLASLLQLRLDPFESDGASSANAECIELARAMYESRDSAAPAEFAQRLARLLACGAVELNAQGTWSFAEDGIGSAAALEALGVSLYERLRELLDAFDTELGELLEGVLYLGACCGERFPVDAILEFLDPSGAQSDDAKEAIDAFLADENEHCVLRDLEFSAPGIGFQSSVYEFRNPLFRSVVLENLHKPDAARMAEFASYLESRLPVRGRATAAMHLSLASFCGDEKLRSATLSELGRFVEMNICEEVEQDVLQQLERRDLNPEVLCTVVERVSQVWPPGRVLALLDAIEKHGIPRSKLTLIISSRSVQLLRSRQFAEAEVAAREVLSLLGVDDQYEGDDVMILGAMRTLALILHEQEKRAEARALSERLVRSWVRLGGEAHPETLGAMDALGRTLTNYTAQSARREACGVLERSWRISQSTLGESHRVTLLRARGLAVALMRAGAFANASQLFQYSLERQRTSLGPEHPDTLETHLSFGEFLRNAKQLDASRGLLEAALKGRLRLRGEDHPETQYVVAELAQTLQEDGQLERAGELLESAVGAWGRMFGVEERSTLLAVLRLGLLRLEQGQAKEAKRLFEDALSTQVRLHGEGNRLAQRLMNELGRVRHAMGDSAGARPLLEQSVTGLRGLLGDSHQDVVLARLYLGQLLTDVGEFEGARRVLEEARAGDQKDGPEGSERTPRILEALARLDP